MVSVQGVLFVLPRELVTSTDWLLAKMVSSEVPWTKTPQGQWYVDVDPTSFRLILGILNGVLDISGQDSATLSNADLVLLKATARYLLLNEIVQAVDEIVTGHERTILELRTEIESLKEPANELGVKASKLERIENATGGSSMTLYECQAYKTHCPYNRCGAKTVVLGEVLMRDGFCHSCDNDTSRLRNRPQFIIDHELKSLEDIGFFLK